jgi:hypothetical protein
MFIMASAGCESAADFSCDEAYDLIVNTSGEQTKRYSSSFVNDNFLPREQLVTMFFPKESGKYDLVVHFYAEAPQDTIPDSRASYNQLIFAGKGGSGDIQIPLEDGDTYQGKKQITLYARNIEESVISKLANMKIESVDLLFSLYVSGCGSKNEIKAFQKRLTCMIKEAG